MFIWYIKICFRYDQAVKLENKWKKSCCTVSRASQKVRFLPNNFFEVSHNFFPLFRSKALQKTKNWKFLWIFSPGWSPSKFYYITLVCEMELGRKFKFFPIFYYKTMLFSSESEFSMKNVIFWGTSCWCSSKIQKIIVKLLRASTRWKNS